MEIVTDRADIDRYQAVLEKNFKRGTSTFTRTVKGANLTWRCKIQWDSRNGVWAHFLRRKSKFWNPFGLDDPRKARHSKDVRNVVQINPSRLGHFNTGGALVVDREAGVVFLAHSGRIGGESVGSTDAFIRTFDTVILTARKKQKAYTIISDIEDPQLNERIAAFVTATAAFKSKRGVKGGSGSTRTLTGDEYAGKIRYRRRGYVASVRLHGRVQQYLRRALATMGIAGLQRDVNRDLYVKRDGLDVLFEIKTGATPYDVYTAVGQLMIHGSGNATSRILVAPRLPASMSEKIRSLGIGTIAYREVGKSIEFEGLDIVRKGRGLRRRAG